MTPAVQGLLAGLGWLALSATTLAQGPAPGAESASTVTIPVNIRLAPLVDYLERHLPRQAGSQGHWQSQRGVQVQYGIQRGPVRAWSRAGRVHVAVPLAYWVRARKTLAKVVKINGSCGIREPPRQVFVHLETALQWTPDWRVTAQTWVYPNQFLNPCRMTIADIDVTPFVDEELTRRITNATRRAMQEQLPDVANLQRLVGRAWSALQSPISLNGALWLSLNPKAVSLTPLGGEGDTLQTIVGLEVEPRVVTGQAPAVGGAPLPSLRSATPAAGGVHLRLEARLDRSQLRHALEAHVLQTARRYGLSGFQLAGADIDLDGDRLVMGLRSEAPVQVTVQVSGRPAWRQSTNAIYLEDAVLAAEGSDPVSRLAAAWMQEQLGNDLDQFTTWPVTGPLETLVRRLEGGLDDYLPGGVRLQAGIVDVAFEQPRLTLRYVILAARVAADARMEIGGSPDNQSLPLKQ